MSGSSLDAIDMALVRFEIDQHSSIASWKLLHTHAEPLSQEWKDRLVRLPRMDLQEFFQTDAELGRWIGSLCQTFNAQTNIVPDAIASHGHTVMHNPSEGYTVQVGNPAGIAQESGCTVISDFRSNDIAAGGQGAPLAPVVEHYLFPGFDFYLNLGGIANLTYRSKKDEWKAWDIAPANQLLNYLAQKVGQPYDNGGMLARNGKISDTLLSALRLPLPLPLTKAFSLDNTWVQEKYMPVLDHADVVIADQLATVTEFIASAIGTQIQSLCKPAAEMQLFITGGGAHNLYLIERITSHIAPIQCVLPERTVMDFKEAMLMSVCGMLRILHIPNAFASVTGASQDTINGKITSAGGTTRKHL